MNYLNKYLFPIYAVILGFLVVRFIKKPEASTKLLLAFSGAFLLSLTIFNPLPEVYEHLGAKQVGLFIMIGILLQIFLEFFSQGAEHGHIHSHSHSKTFPWVLFTSLCIHAFLEGFPIHQHNDMVYGVLIHKIPIALLITSFLYQSHFKDWQVILALLFFAVMTPLGTYISNVYMPNSEYLPYINAVVIGIFLHISTVILFESSEGHKFNLGKLLAITSAVAIAYAM